VWLGLDIQFLAKGYPLRWRHGASASLKPIGPGLGREGRGEPKLGPPQLRRGLPMLSTALMTGTPWADLAA
jgi:hypothetical protein